MEINYTTQIWKEGKMYVSFEPKLDVASCGYTIDEARKNLDEAVSLFLQEAHKKGSLKRILEEAGYIKAKKQNWQAPELLSLEKRQVFFKVAI